MARRFPRRFSAVAGGCLAALALFVFAGAPALAGWQWRMVRKKIHADFPQVRQISTAALAAWLDDPRGKASPPLLLDVRTAPEFAVSHLAGAQRVEPGASVADAKLSGVKKEALIVTYCSVGCRSSAFAETLRAAGFVNVQNLDGSIFQWANENRPLVDARGQPTEKAHPYNAFWGRMLRAQHRASTPQ